MKKLLVMLTILGILIFSGCNRTTRVAELDSGQKIKITIDGAITEEQEQYIINYIRSDAEKHYATSDEPYKFVSRN